MRYSSGLITTAVSLYILLCSCLFNRPEIHEESGIIFWEGHWEVVQLEGVLKAQVVVPVTEPIEPGQLLHIEVIFSEPMDTSSVTVKAGRRFDFDQLSVHLTNWSCTDNAYPFFDTWNGTITVPPTGFSDRIDIRVTGADIVGNPIKDFAEYNLNPDEPSDLFLENSRLDAQWVESSSLVSIEPNHVFNLSIKFSEPIDTATVTVEAGRGPEYNQLSVQLTNWSCTNNPYPFFDTWNGTITIPSTSYAGSIHIRVSGSDLDGNPLLDILDYPLGFDDAILLYLNNHRVENN